MGLVRKVAKGLCRILHLSPADLLERSVRKAVRQQGLLPYFQRLQQIVPDISSQYSNSRVLSSFATTKLRAQQAFQMRLFERAVRLRERKEMTVVDIGDSAGTHLSYIRSLCGDIRFRTISVNLDTGAVAKIRAKGMEAVACRAEDLDLGEKPIDLFVTFQMLEHLMDPCSFLRKLATKGKSDFLLVTVPFRRASCIGLGTYRAWLPFLNRNDVRLETPERKLAETSAEDEHVFELSPLDWKFVMLFSGWKPVYDEVYYQYPRRDRYSLTKRIWAKLDFEGFWGVVLERDLSFSNRYRDWPDLRHERQQEH